jgi:signal transduction histidine kinase
MAPFVRLEIVFGSNKLTKAPSGAPPTLMREWLGLSVFLIFLCVALTLVGHMRRVDLAFFDAFAPLLEPPAPKKIAIIEIDDATVAALGGWPIRRAIHAELIDRLTQIGVSAIALDLIMADGSDDRPVDDEILANAMKRNERVVTPIVTSTVDAVTSAVLPVDSIARASFGVGHINVHTSRDGVVRSFRLREGNNEHIYPALSDLVLQASGARPARCSEKNWWVADHWKGSCLRYVPIGRPTAYDMYSYIAVLRGEVPAQSLRGRIVLIGATASGASARLATSDQSLSGVEFLAEATHALTNATLVRQTGILARLAFDLVAVLLLCAALICFGPRASLLACIALAILICLVAYVLLSAEHVFIYPGAAFVVCTVAYPLWAWRRQEALLKYLTVEAQRVMAEPYLPDEPVAVRESVDPVQRRLVAMTSLVARVRRYREFLSEWIESLPEATLLVASSGDVVLANAKAGALMAGGKQAERDATPLAGRQIVDVLSDVTSSYKVTTFAADALAAFGDAASNKYAGGERADRFKRGIEIVDERGRSLLIKCAAIQATRARGPALVFHISDITSMRQAERQRDTTLRFLSHDIRSPQASILTLLEQLRRSPENFPGNRFTELVEHYATTALKLADDFLLLALAESQPPKLVKLDLAALVADAIDDLWVLADARGTTVQLVAQQGSLVLADAPLMRRAFANLIGNAIKYGPDNATVVVEISHLATAWRVSVFDRGVGIEESDREKLFNEFVRVGSDQDRPGVGLGLALVKTVVDQAGGSVSVQSTVGVGSEFIVLLPDAAMSVLPVGWRTEAVR